MLKWGEKMAENPDLIEFYGTECKHCNDMKPLVERLEQELNIKLKKLETWHNEANMKKLQELDQGKCGGVPFFINTKSGKFICGSTTYEKLKAWAEGK
jgi:thiol-disulfide isomerase/thioredoxin